jgi:3-oxoacyl-[acyl-carrier protein] reductase
VSSILITGGTRGIGLALCKAFARKGWQVASCYHEDEASAQAARDEMSKLTQDFLLLKGDVSLEEPVGEMVKAVIEKFGRLDCVIHNAGFTLNARLLDVEEGQWDATMSVHLKGAFWLAKAGLRPMLKQKDGQFIFISSVVATTGNIGQGSYTAAKAGVTGLMRSLAAEYGGKNIRANVVCPGFHKTRLSENLSPEAEAAIRKRHLLTATTDINEVGDFMVWLAGTKTISGQVFNLDSRLPGYL